MTGRRWFLHVLTALSLAMLALCLISFLYPLKYGYSHGHGETTFHFWLFRGTASISKTHGSMGLIGHDGWPRLWHFEHHASENGYAYEIEIDTMGFMVLLGLWPLWFYSGRFRVWLRRDPAACRRCGYNLTGNTSGVCPECGTATTAIPAEGRNRAEPS